MDFLNINISDSMTFLVNVNGLRKFKENGPLNNEELVG